MSTSYPPGLRPVGLWFTRKYEAFFAQRSALILRKGQIVNTRRRGNLIQQTVKSNSFTKIRAGLTQSLIYKGLPYGQKIQFPIVFFGLRLFSLILLVFLVSISYSFSQNDTPIEAKVNKNKVETGEIFIYTIKIEGEFLSPKLTLPELKDFQIAAQNQSKNYSFSANKVVTKINLAYHLLAAKPGTFTIKEVVLEDKDKKFKSNSLTIEVTGKPLEDKNKINNFVGQGTEI